MGEKILFQLALGSLLVIGNTHGQEKNSQVHRYDLIQTTEEITIDGVPDEAIWAEAHVATDFVLNSPVDHAPPVKQTEVRMVYDAAHLYVLAICYGDEDYMIQTLKRDNFGNSDDFGVLIDPLGRKASGYGFGVNAMNAQTEVAISADGTDGSWDNRWFSAVTRHPDRWIVEMKIPLKSIRYQAQNKSWGLNFVRVDPRNNETSVWSPVPRQFPFHDIGFFGTMVWPEAPGRSGGNISVIPFTTVRADKTADGTEYKLEAGGDVKISITPSLNMDLTTLPDFSQVEVDAQVTNLTRFSIFFPERRQFFIENSDIFNGFGQGSAVAFFSRRIGLDERNEPVPILYGARLTGNVGERLRIGAFNIHTQARGDAGSDNFSAVAFQQRVWERSRIRGIFLNRQGYSGGKSESGNFGRNLGGDFIFTSSNGKIAAQAGYMHAFKGAEFDHRNGQFYGGVAYNGQRFRGFLDAYRIGENYFADMGLTLRLENYDPDNDRIVRIGYTNVRSFLDYYIYPAQSKSINFHWSGIENIVWVNDDGSGLNEWYTRVRHFLFFKNTSVLRFRLNNHFVRLIFPFGITETPLPVGDYNMTEFNIQYNSDSRKRWVYDVFGVYGGFYNGYKHTYIAGLTYRAQPWGNFRLSTEHNHIRLPEPYGRAKITLATLRAEINFSTRLFWTTFLQYNTQADNFNINSRIQYRFAPMSDIFLVYTDNYRIEGMFGNKNRSVVLKVNYWLTL